MPIKIRAFHFKGGDPYAGGPCILEDRTVAWAAMSDEDDGTGGKLSKLILFPIDVEDRRQGQPTMAHAAARPSTMEKGPTPIATQYHVTILDSSDKKLIDKSFAADGPQRALVVAATEVASTMAEFPDYAEVTPSSGARQGGPLSYDIFTFRDNGRGNNQPKHRGTWIRSDQM